MEQSRIKHLLEDEKIKYYNRYVDDIFIIYNHTKITPQCILEQFNGQHKNLQFTINEEVNNQITYLDLNITNTNIKIAFKTTHTIGNLINKTRQINPYEHSGIYKLTCQSSQKVYIGQTGRNLTTRYTEHIRNIRLNKDESAFAQRILNNLHQYGPMAVIMEMIEKAKKGGIMNIKEDFYIYQFNKFNKLIEEQKYKRESNSLRSTSMFDLIIHHQNTPTLTSQTQQA
ncbi:hypothetical protein B7P43_G18100 [Cryptotermes secundus]|uniref:GIY-YIG domain-containing protein n=1 Tax=Cryptotermes secundus TaxID=105785 RepID=A0A2J7PYD6_9NEOP|nr:hypothetical protein B7P43_G18100 [Cryptotermes secundus]